MKKKFLSVVLAATMAAGLVTGCGSSAQQSAAGGSPEKTETSSSDAGTAAGPETQDTEAPEAGSAEGESNSETGSGDGKTIKIGVICTLTGGSAIYGEGAQNAVDMAVEEINAGDSEYKVEIINGGKGVDDASDAKQAINAYNSLMKESPDAVVGCFFSSVTLPIAEQASKDGMLLIATGATNKDVTLKGPSIDVYKRQNMDSAISRSCSSSISYQNRFSTLEAFKSWSSNRDMTFSTCS